MEGVEFTKETKQLIVENFYEYIRTKAMRFLDIGLEQYRKTDAFKMPSYKMDRNTLALLQEGCRQVSIYRGLTCETAFEGLGIPAFYKLMQLFHFKIVKQSTACADENHITDEMQMEHIVSGQKMKLYNKVQKHGNRRQLKK